MEDPFGCGNSGRCGKQEIRFRDKLNGLNTSLLSPRTMVKIFPTLGSDIVLQCFSGATPSMSFLNCGMSFEEKCHWWDHAHSLKEKWPATIAKLRKNCCP